MVPGHSLSLMGASMGGLKRGYLDNSKGSYSAYQGLAQVQGATSQYHGLPRGL